MERKTSGTPPAFPVPAGATDTQNHIYLPGHPAQPGGIDLPLGDAGPDVYGEMMDWLGLERTVITQANAHMFDNTNLCAALEAFGDRARGVAVITADTSRGELARLHDAGVRGARIMDFSGGAMPLARMSEVMDVASDMGWVLAVQFDGSRILEHLSLLKSIPGQFIIDHHGKFQSHVGEDDPEIHAILALMDRGNCWYKLAGCYQTFNSALPDCSQAGSISRQIVSHAVDRVIWGTNWPHGDALTSADYPDDAQLMNLLSDWAPSPEDREKILAVNPAKLFDFASPLAS